MIFKINSGFNPGFEMLMPTKEGELKKYSLTVWKENIKNWGGKQEKGAA